MRFLLPLATALVLGGCGTPVYTLAPADAEALAAANRRFADRPATVRLVTGEAFAARALRLAPDSATWIDPASGTLRAVPTLSVRHVERRDRAHVRRHVVRQQVIFGAVVGAIGGGLMGDLFARGFPFGDTDPSLGRRAAGIALGAAIGGGMGALEGQVVGEIAAETVPDTERYVILPTRVLPHAEPSAADPDGAGSHRGVSSDQ